MSRGPASWRSGARVLFALASLVATGAAQDDRKNGPWKPVPPKASRPTHEAALRIAGAGVEREQGLPVVTADGVWVVGVEWRYDEGDALPAWPALVSVSTLSTRVWRARADFGIFKKQLSQILILAFAAMAFASALLITS